MAYRQRAITLSSALNAVGISTVVGCHLRTTQAWPETEKFEPWRTAQQVDV
jgi:hypothetical protein